jgi:hypothetical protein
MGRQAAAATAAGRTRSTARAIDRADDGSSTITFSRRFPRLGSAYQTKAPASTEDCYQPTRRPPALLSREYPQSTQAEIDEDLLEVEGESDVHRRLVWGLRTSDRGSDFLRASGTTWIYPVPSDKHAWAQVAIDRDSFILYAYYAL